MPPVSTTESSTPSARRPRRGGERRTGRRPGTRAYLPPPRRAARRGARPADQPFGGFATKEVRPEDRPTYDSGGGSVEEQDLADGRARGRERGSGKMHHPRRQRAMRDGKLVPSRGKRKCLRAQRRQDAAGRQAATAGKRATNHGPSSALPENDVSSSSGMPRGDAPVFQPKLSDGVMGTPARYRRAVTPASAGSCVEGGQGNDFGRDRQAATSASAGSHEGDEGASSGDRQAAALASAGSPD